MTETTNISELLIASVTPQNLERGDLWFSENYNAIKKARVSNPWWRDNAFFVEKNLVLKPHELVRKLLTLGYERSQSVIGKGIFAVRGGIIEIWPIHTKQPFLIEFAGNAIEAIHERKEMPEIAKPKIHVRTIEHLSPGNFVVHVDHGIGVYRGLTENLEFSERNLEKYKKDSGFKIPDSGFYIIEYASPRPGADPDKLYVPVSQKDRLSPYIGFEQPKIHRLGGAVWHNTKRKIKEDTETLARELLEIYARRHQAERLPYAGDPAMEREVRQTFIFEETPDQLVAEKEIMSDLEGTKPMDRILCGDVGFGKTEIALRAVLRVIASGRQAAVLSPTTILAAQHEKTFKERIENKLPIKVASLSRLTPKPEEKKILEEVKLGGIDCIIGTHRLLSKDVEFKNLGLVVIDEEQRFGVKQKEQFKDLRSDVDVLSLSATPIPRTLYLAIVKLRDLSLLSAPPPERLAIVTAVLPYAKKTVRGAIEYELKRDGQVYFLHNRIETIEAAKQRVENMFRRSPHGKNLKIGIMHGRMGEKDILRTMEKFRKREINVLIATTIIENGLDISSANTLIVDDATRLGLAEAHQLRGRVGRGNEQAFAYFLYKPRHLTEKAGERLEALKEYSELGSGYQIALRDLEIRGAGNILGKEQSGAINKVGLNLYCQMLAEAIEEFKGNSSGDRVI